LLCDRDTLVGASLSEINEKHILTSELFRRLIKHIIVFSSLPVSVNSKKFVCAWFWGLLRTRVRRAVKFIAAQQLHPEVAAQAVPSPSTTGSKLSQGRCCGNVDLRFNLGVGPGPQAWKKRCRMCAATCAAQGASPDPRGALRSQHWTPPSRIRLGGDDCRLQYYSHYSVISVPVISTVDITGTTEAPQSPRDRGM